MFFKSALVGSGFGFVLSCVLLAFADVQIPAMVNPLADFACELRVSYGPSAPRGERDEVFCSGTFLKSNLFVTAGHCLLGKRMAGDLSQHVHERFYVSCPGGRLANVKAAMVHPSFFEQSCFDSRGQLDPKPHFSLTDPKNDIAALMTEVISGTSRFPQLPPEAPLGFLKKSSCSILSFSPSICRPTQAFSDEASCFRAGLSVGPGEVPFLRVESGRFAEGDSGGGVICPDGRGGLSLEGIYVTTASPRSAVSTTMQSGFLRPLLRFSEAEFMAAARKITYSRRSFQALERLDFLNARLKAAGSGARVVCFGRSSQCLSAVLALGTAISRSGGFVEWLQRLGIKVIEIHEKVLRTKYVIERSAPALLILSPDVTSSDLVSFERSSR